MRICRGWAKRPLSLLPERRYHPEQVLNMIKPLPREPASPLVRQPVWLCVEGQYLRLNSLPEMELACRLVCACHNKDGEFEDEAQDMDESDE